MPGLIELPGKGNLVCASLLLNGIMLQQFME
jgi:hypothetical protein